MHIDIHIYMFVSACTNAQNYTDTRHTTKYIDRNRHMHLHLSVEICMHTYQIYMNINIHTYAH